MADQRVVRKSLGGQEDLLFGERIVSQSRAGGNYNITGIRLAYPVNSLAELNALDPVQFPKAVLWLDGTATRYVYNTSTEQYEVVQSQDVVLTDGQTTVEDVNAYADFSATNLQDGTTNLVLSIGYTITSATVIELTDSFPAGTVLQAR